MKVHFIAIGGSAMHNLALALHDRGYEVSGSDDVIFEPSKSRLQAAGILPASQGWDPKKIHKGLEAVILGMHAKKDNPELARALELGLPVYSYPEFIYEQSKHKTRVVIGGSHGKTTITSMILHVLKYHRIETDFMVGAQLEGFDRMVRLTDENDFIVLEGDEYLSSPLDDRPKFLHYKANIALLSGIAWDHINVFPTLENYKAQFQKFPESIVPGGSITYNTEDSHLNQMVSDFQAPIRKFPYQTPEHRIENHTTYLMSDYGEVPLEVFGRHNLNNLQGAKWICQQMGVDQEDFYEAISSFKGASKRLQKIYESSKTLVFKDFAHSPSKVKASVAAMREQYPDKNLVACLELHTYSSLNKSFLTQYEGSLDAADQAVVYYAPESLKIKNLPEVAPEDISNAFAKEGLQVFTRPDAFEEFLRNTEKEQSVCLLMSSGNYGGMDLNAFISELA